MTIDETGEQARRIADQVQSIVPTKLVQEVDAGADEAAAIAGTDTDAEGTTEQWAIYRDFVLTPGTQQLRTTNKVTDKLTRKGWTIGSDGPADGDGGRQVTLTSPDAPGYAIRLITGNDDPTKTGLIRLAVFGPVLDTSKSGSK